MKFKSHYGFLGQQAELNGGNIEAGLAELAKLFDW